jgi:hypothetical protein
MSYGQGQQGKGIIGQEVTTWIPVFTGMTEKREDDKRGQGWQKMRKFSHHSL